MTEEQAKTILNAVLDNGINPDGSVDPTINFGAGCDNFVASLAVLIGDTMFGLRLLEAQCIEVIAA